MLETIAFFAIVDGTSLTCHLRSTWCICCRFRADHAMLAFKKEVDARWEEHRTVPQVASTSLLLPALAPLQRAFGAYSASRHPLALRSSKTSEAADPPYTPPLRSTWTTCSGPPSRPVHSEACRQPHATAVSPPHPFWLLLQSCLIGNYSDVTPILVYTHTNLSC